ncbi:TonB-dependent receptor [Sphingobacterium sp. MYb388]|uniref:TonB-dependent receptor n=1 Tax=Sphingobacterium sp. MYb388 TaxID=2745437 RepID=UPI00309BBC9E
MKKELMVSVFCSMAVMVNAQERFYGTVKDEQGLPLPFASVTSLTTNISYMTDRSGNFDFDVQTHDSIRIKVAYLGKQTLNRSYTTKQSKERQTIVLRELSLTLDEVNILPDVNNNGHSNSSIHIDKQAIDQLQAFSLVDVMNALPGKKTLPLDLNSLSTLTLRGGELSNPVFDLNNSQGIAIVIDDMRISNDANLQTRGLARGGLNGSTLTSNGYRDSYFGNQNAKSYDTPFQGIDLRDIPVNNIEKIEVIQGIAPARYGEVTNGAVIIDRQAGKSPYVTSFNINGGSTNSSLSKGFLLSPKWGALNSSTNWTYSNADPKDKVKSFHRYTQSLMWTNVFGKIKNTLSLDYSGRNDNSRQDPDDATLRTSKFTNNTFSLNNRMGIQIGKQWMKNLQVNSSISLGKQKSYASYAVNRGLTPIAYLDTTGIYEGKYVYLSTMTEELIIGKPVNASVNLSANGYVQLGSISHNLSYGTRFNYSNNGGQGVVSDPERPRLVGYNQQNLRPYSFEHIPSAKNWSLYLEDQFDLTLGRRIVSNNLGVRYDVQNGYGTIQPRFNSRLQWNQRWTFTGALGIATKAPSLAQLYPGPTFIDYDLITASAGGIDPSLYLLYTDKIQIDNSRIKPSKSFQVEFGVERKSLWVNSSMYAYYKKNSDGFYAMNNLRRYELPQYTVWLNQTTNKFEYASTGETLVTGGFIDHQLTNGLASESYGFEWYLSTPKIAVIATSFSLNTSYNYTKAKSALNDASTPETKTYLDENRYIKTLYYEPLILSTKSLISKLNTVTHFSRIGFVINFSLDINIMGGNQTLSSLDPIAYLDDNIRYYTLTADEAKGAPFNTLANQTKDSKTENTPFVYTTMNMGFEKEIRKNFRVNMRVYNLLDLRPYKLITLDNGVERIFNPNTKPSLTIGTTIKF